MEGGNKFSRSRLGKVGDEATAFHRMRLQYDASTQTAKGWLDDVQIGTLNYPMSGRIQFELVTNTDKKDNEIDVYYERFELLIGSKLAAPGLTP